MGDFTWLENGSMRCLLVSAAFPLPHQSAATLSDIKAALAERGLCVVPKGRHDWVLAEEVMKRDEEIARLTAQLTAEQQRRQEVERRECLDHQEIAEALGILEQLPDQAGVVAEIVRLRAELAEKTPVTNPPGIPESSNPSKSSNGSPNPPGISESSVEPDESDPLPWHSAATAPRSEVKS